MPQRRVGAHSPIDHAGPPRWLFWGVIGALIFRAIFIAVGAALLSAFSDAMNPAPEISAHNLGRAYLEEKNYA